MDEQVVFQAILKGLSEYGITDHAVATSVAKHLQDAGVYGERSQGAVPDEVQLELI